MPVFYLVLNGQKYTYYILYIEHAKIFYFISILCSSENIDSYEVVLYWV